MDGNKLDSTTAEKDLGMTIRTDFSVDNRIIEIIKKANKLTDMLVGNIQCNDKSINGSGPTANP